MSSLAFQYDIKCPDRAGDSDCTWYELCMKNLARVTASVFILTAGLGLAGLGAATAAQAQPGPFPQWCPGDFWDPGWGSNPDGFHCHDGGPGFRGHDDGRGPGFHDGRGRH